MASDPDTSPGLLDLATQQSVKVSSTISGTALGFQHTGADVATEKTLDFVDGNGVTWTVTDDGANDRVTASAQVVAIGALSARPGAATANTGAIYYATDQVSLSISDGTTWHRIGPAAAGDIIWTNEASARTGYLLLTGQAWPGTTGIYADLHSLWGGTNLPDVQGRMLVGKGTHVDVSTLLNTEGLATVANRRPKHQTTDAKTVSAGTLAASRTADVSLGDPGHGHLYREFLSPGGGGTAIGPAAVGEGTGGHADVSTIIQPNTTGITVSQQPTFGITGSPALGGTIGSNNGNDSTDTSPYIVLQPQVKL